MILASLLSSSKYIIVNKDLIKMLGLNEAVILGELCSEYTYWENTNQLDDEGYFYSTRENIDNNTGINAHFQRSAMKNLEGKGILISKKMGIPCKRYYKINENEVIKVLQEAKIIAKSPVVHEVNDKKETTETSSEATDESQDGQDINGNNNNINNKIINNEEHTHDEPEPIEEKEIYSKLVSMTKSEYLDLLKTYGEEITKQLIEQLSLYKQANGVKYDNDYAAIIRWVTTRIHEIEKEDAKYREFKNNKSKSKANFCQRDYPSDFFDNLYAN